MISGHHEWLVNILLHVQRPQQYLSSVLFDQFKTFDWLARSGGHPSAVSIRWNQNIGQAPNVRAIKCPTVTHTVYLFRRRTSPGKLLQIAMLIR